MTDDLPDELSPTEARRRALALAAGIRDDMRRGAPPAVGKEMLTVLESEERVERAVDGMMPEIAALVQATALERRITFDGALGYLLRKRRSSSRLTSVLWPVLIHDGDARSVA